MPKEPVYSPDGNWVWDGQAWRPVYLAHRPGLFWFFDAADWVLPVFLTTLIGLIPIVGLMVAYGWVLETRDNLRRGQPVVPPASFTYLNRGALPAVAVLILSAVYWLLLMALIGVLVAAVIARPSTPVIAALITVPVSTTLAFLAVQAFLFAGILAITDRYGLREGLNLQRLWRVSSANGSAPWRVAAAYAFGALLTLLIPLVGYFFTAGAYLMATPALAEFDETIEPA